MPNIKKNISRHNNKLLQAEIKQQNPALFPPDHCNCQARYKPDCPIPGKCNANNVIYRAHVTWQNNNIGETYTGVTKNFKTRYGAHKGSFTHEGQNKSTLSRFIWDNLKGPTNLHKLPYNIKWDIVKRGSLFNPLTGVCRLCNWEKFFILFRPEGASLNQRSEFFSYCKHKEPQLLKLVKI